MYLFKTKLFLKMLSSKDLDMVKNWNKINLLDYESSNCCNCKYLSSICEGCFYKNVCKTTINNVASSYRGGYYDGYRGRYEQPYDPYYTNYRTGYFDR